jgi:Delta14-sterol reductase
MARHASPPPARGSPALTHARSVPTSAPARAAPAPEEPLNPRTTHFEFGGPLGAAGMLIGLPAVTLAFSTLANERGWPSTPDGLAWADVRPADLARYVAATWDMRVFLAVVT